MNRTSNTPAGKFKIGLAVTVCCAGLNVIANENHPPQKPSTAIEYHILDDDGGEHPATECRTVSDLPKQLKKSKKFTESPTYISSLQSEFGEDNEAAIDNWEHYFSTADGCSKALAQMKQRDADLTADDAALQDFLQNARSRITNMLEAAARGDFSKAGQIKTELEGLNKQLHGNRKEARTYNETGLAALKTTRYQDAIAAFTTATAYDQGDAEIAANLGFALLKNGQFTAALDPLLRSLSLQPGRSSSWVGYAEALARNGNADNAKAAFMLTFEYSQDKAKTRAFLQKLSEENQDFSLRKAIQSALTAQPSEESTPLTSDSPQARLIPIPAIDGLPVGAARAKLQSVGWQPIIGITTAGAGADECKNKLAFLDQGFTEIRNRDNSLQASGESSWICEFSYGDIYGRT